MAKDWYVEVPNTMPSTLGMVSLRSRKGGMALVGCYYELLVMVASSLQEHQEVGRRHVDALAHQWGMTPAKTEELLDEFAALGLIDAACWEEGLIRIQSVADRFMYKEGKAAAQRESVAARRANKAASAAP